MFTWRMTGLPIIHYTTEGFTLSQSLKASSGTLSGIEGRGVHLLSLSNVCGTAVQIVVSNIG